MVILDDHKFPIFSLFLNLKRKISFLFGESILSCKLEKQYFYFFNIFSIYEEKKKTFI